MPIVRCLQRHKELLPSAATVTTQLNAVLFRSTFKVTQLAGVERVVSLTFSEEPGWRDFVAGARHLAPSFAVFFMPEMTGATGGDVHLASSSGDTDGNHVPEIFGHDISDDEIDLFGGVYCRALEFYDVTRAVGVP